MAYQTLRYTGFLLIILFFAGFTYILINYMVPVNMEEGFEVTEYVVVDEFQGKDFSSADDFRENSIKGPQIVDINNYELKITGLVDQAMNLSYDTILDSYPSYKKDATLNCVEGWSVRILWEGIEVRQILAAAGVKEEAKTIIFKAVDGYTTSFPIDYIQNNKIIMAHKMNNEVLRAERGFPFQLVAESTWGYKWIKWIEEIELSDDENYKGFWESRGYSNSGDLDKPKFD